MFFNKLIPTPTELWNSLAQQVLNWYFFRLFQNTLILLHIDDPKEICLCNVLIMLEIRTERLYSFVKTIMKPISCYHLSDDFIMGIETFGKFHCTLVENERIRQIAS